MMGTVILYTYGDGDIRKFHVPNVKVKVIKKKIFFSKAKSME